MEGVKSHGVIYWFCRRCGLARRTTFLQKRWQPSSLHMSKHLVHSLLCCGSAVVVTASIGLTTLTSWTGSVVVMTPGAALQTAQTPTNSTRRLTFMVVIVYRPNEPTEHDVFILARGWNSWKKLFITIKHLVYVTIVSGEWTLFGSWKVHVFLAIELKRIIHYFNISS